MLRSNPFVSLRLPPRWEKKGWRYSLAIGSFGIVFLLRYVLGSWFPGDRGFLLFLPAVFFTALYGGATAATLTAGLSGLAIWYVFLPPSFSIKLSPGALVTLASDAFVMAITIALIDWLRTVIEELRREKANYAALAERDKLLGREFRHRTKNLLAIVHGLTVRTLKEHTNVVDAQEALVGRLEALARADQSLVGRESSGTNLGYLVQSELAAFAGRFLVDGPDVILDRKTAQDLSLALHELATNATKYGALSTSTGHVKITWTVCGNDPFALSFRWKEVGGPPVASPKRQGFGTALLQGMSRQSRLQYESDGVLYEANFEISQVAQVANVSAKVVPLTGGHMRFRSPGP